MKILAYRCGLPKNDRLGTREMGNRLIIDLAGKNFPPVPYSIKTLF